MVEDSCGHTVKACEGFASRPARGAKQLGSPPTSSRKSAEIRSLGWSKTVFLLMHIDQHIEASKTKPRQGVPSASGHATHGGRRFGALRGASHQKEARTMCQ